MSLTISPACRLLVALAIAAATHSLVSAQSNLAGTGDDALRAAVERFLTAFQNMDWEAFRAVWAEEPTVFFPFDDTPERVTGKDAVEARWRRFFDERPRPADRKPPYFIVNHRQLLVQQYGEAAIVTFNLGQTTTATGRRTLVFVREKGVWKLAHLHASMSNP